MTEQEYRAKCRQYGINDRERELWVLNSEGLYNWHKRSRLSISAFVREYRREIAEYIIGELD